MTDYVRYSPELEKPEKDESETIQQLVDAMVKGLHTVHEEQGRVVRIAHAKAHAFLKGELVIADGLPPELAQGLFARPGRHPVVARLSQAPGEPLDDRKVSSPRAFAIKIFDVEGEKIPQHKPATTQDFLCVTGKTFLAATLKAFLLKLKPNVELAPKLPEGLKGAVSHVARGINTMFHAVGGDSGTLDFLGHPKYHPLGEHYFSQVPMRYGDFVAKVSIAPATPELKALFEQTVDMHDENALRTAIREWFATRGAEFDFSVQLATDPKKMPIEDPTVEWPETLSPFRKVATLRFAPQESYAPARQKFVDERMSFSPAHSLAAHRPLGAIMRARLQVYPALALFRRHEQGSADVEVTHFEDVP